MEYVIVLAVLFAVVLVVSAPLRRRSGGAGEEQPSGPEAVTIAELDAAREAKYREIRDAELDHRTGKLSDADFRAVDRTLRAEAIEILRALDRAHAQAGEAQQISATIAEDAADHP